MYDIVVIGHLLRERIIFADGKEAGPLLGGPASYSAAAAGSLGIKVGLVTKIGTDMPECLLKVFESIGVDTKGMMVGKKSTSNLLVYDKEGGKRLEFLNRAENIIFEDIPLEYLNSRFFLISAVNYEVSENLISELHGKGKRLSMELSGFGGASSQIGRTKEEKIRMLSRVTRYFNIVKGGREDYSRIFGDTESPERTVKRFLDWGAEISIVTLGENGSIVVSNKECVKIAPIPARVVDVTGAGDVWHAGFVSEYLKSGDIKKAGQFACAVASAVIEKSGGVVKERFPDGKEVSQRMRFY
jgi:sugar/nucleoside kinase (ribokinase family)